MTASAFGATSPADEPTPCLARQPIMDTHERVVGYELLYRASPDAAGCSVDGDMASARVLTAAVSAIGLDVLTGGRPAFVNFTKSMLLNAATLLPPAALMIELHQDIPVDEDVIDACRSLSDAGYNLGLDDFVAGSPAEALLPYVKFVKVDVLKTPEDERLAIAARLKPQGIRLVALKVETAAMLADARAMGYQLFQGYYFLRPTTYTGKSLPDSKVNYLRLVAALNRPELSVAQLEDLVKSDVTLSYRVLSAVNSSAYALRRDVSTIREALVLLGRDQIRKWASVWALSSLDGGAAPETMSVALLRARACQYLGEAGGHPDLFLLGLCSALDSVVARPMSELVAALSLSPAIADALLGRPSDVRLVLDAAVAYERGDWQEAEDAARQIGLSPALLSEAYVNALQWTQSLSGAA